MRCFPTVPISPSLYLHYYTDLRSCSGFRSSRVALDIGQGSLPRSGSLATLHCYHLLPTCQATSFEQELLHGFLQLSQQPSLVPTSLQMLQSATKVSLAIDKSQSSSGMGPVKSFPSRYTTYVFVKEPSSDGTEPSNLLLLRKRPTDIS